jgi:uncharacterized protein (TIGR02001 family)
MKKTLLATAIASAVAIPSAASAQLTGNATLASDYRFRGISQTFKGPAIQGGADYVHGSGFYIGNWNSSVTTLSYANGSGIEMDFYGGWKKTWGDWGFDGGLLQYYYPNARVNNAQKTKYNTLEAYVAGSWKFLSLKYSHTLGDYFGVNNDTFGGSCNRDGRDCFAARPGDSNGSGYLDFTATYEIMPKLTLVGHVGRQTVKNYSKLNYTDYKVGLTYDWNGWLLGAAFVTTDADKKWYYVGDTGSTASSAGTAAAGRIRETGTATVVLSVGKTF